jgi:hypothetical protein
MYSKSGTYWYILVQLYGIPDHGISEPVTVHHDVKFLRLSNLITSDFADGDGPRPGRTTQRPGRPRPGDVSWHPPGQVIRAGVRPDQRAAAQAWMTRTVTAARLRLPGHRQRGVTTRTGDGRGAGISLESRRAGQVSGSESAAGGPSDGTSTGVTRARGSSRRARPVTVTAARARRRSRHR